MNQSYFETNTCNQRQARENACDEVTIVFTFAFIGRENGANFANQSLNWKPL